MIDADMTISVCGRMSSWSHLDAFGGSHLGDSRLLLMVVAVAAGIDNVPERVHVGEREECPNSSC